MDPLIKVENLSKHFQISRHETLKAVEDVSFDIYEGETVGLVGESGCGKSTTGRCMVKLYKPTSGKVLYNGKDIFSENNAREKLEYCKNTQMIFQNPYSSLNPRMTVKDIVGEGIRLHENIGNKELDERIEELLKAVGLNRDHMSRFSHEFSGGQRQRIGIARALSVNPKFIVCDEPISALDVSIQAQVLNMLKKLQKERNLTYLFIAHDLSVVKYISDKVIVMYLGMIMEQSPAEELYRNPLHPYTKALLSAIPEADPAIARNKERIRLKGEIPSPINPKNCCRFVERCSYAMPICSESIPELKGQGDHRVACHLY
ncbi:ABC transporter ATP-binding protein [Sedimentibacter sp.]|uniref:ABC transporter ATP-binding protein n=1 Tax=Sedimentibacter sp. TaxID=1960295 RepID=UPI0028A15AE0|nr:ABC transporter ATP-binding protein [Sedimentibacter sp.]